MLFQWDETGEGGLGAKSPHPSTPLHDLARDLWGASQGGVRELLEPGGRGIFAFRAPHHSAIHFSWSRMMHRLHQFCTLRAWFGVFGDPTTTTESKKARGHLAKAHTHGMFKCLH